MSELSELISDIEKQVSDLLHDIERCTDRNTKLLARIELLEGALIESVGLDWADKK